MAEPQYYPSISVAGVPTLVDGVELQNGDAALLGKISGLADDRVISELLRLMPYDGSGNPVARAIIPMGYSWYTQLYNPLTAGSPLHNVYATVAPSGSANGSLSINPFRAVVGSRVVEGSGALDNWRDMRSSVFVGSATTKSVLAPIPANSSGNPRWDLIYAAVTLDAQQNSVQRRVKAPTTAAVSINTVYQYLATTVAIQGVTGTPGATPALPSMPADSGSTYNIALALVLVPNGWNSTSTVVPEQIRDVAPVVSPSSTLGALGIRPANQQHDRINSDGSITPGSYGTDAADFGWDIATPHRSPLFLPPSMVGGETRLILMDFATASHHSHSNGDLLDDSIDWRNRFFRVTAFVSNSEKFACDPTAGTNPSVPHPLSIHDGGLSFGMGNSFILDGLYTSGYATVWREDPTFASGFQTSTQFAPSTSAALLCDLGKGTLHAGVSGNPGVRLFLWVEASGQLANNTTARP